MTGLLVSVRSASEAQAALLGGADIIDVKEPSLGSLGAASADVWQEVANVVKDQVSLSLALGELLEFDRLPGPNLPSQTDYAKIGLAGCKNVADWPTRWKRAWEFLPSTVQRVAVCYVDAERAQAPPWQQILEEASSAGCKCLLLDTFDKRAGNLLAHWSVPELAQVVVQSASQGLFVVAGGSLTGEDLRSLYGTGIRFLAVRGAVCRTNRTGPLDGALVRELRVAMDATLATISAG